MPPTAQDAEATTTPFYTTKKFKIIITIVIICVVVGVTLLILYLKGIIGGGSSPSGGNPPQGQKTGNPPQSGNSPQPGRNAPSGNSPQPGRNAPQPGRNAPSGSPQAGYPPSSPNSCPPETQVDNYLTYSKMNDPNGYLLTWAPSDDSCINSDNCGYGGCRVGVMGPSSTTPLGNGAIQNICIKEPTTKDPGPTNDSTLRFTWGEYQGNDNQDTYQPEEISENKFYLYPGTSTSPENEPEKADVQVRVSQFACTPINSGERVAIAYTNEPGTGTCGAYGCRVLLSGLPAAPNENGVGLARFGHGGVDTYIMGSSVAADDGQQTAATNAGVLDKHPDYGMRIVSVDRGPDENPIKLNEMVYIQIDDGTISDSNNNYLLCLGAYSDWDPNPGATTCQITNIGQWRHLDSGYPCTFRFIPSKTATTSSGASCEAEITA